MRPIDADDLKKELEDLKYTQESPSIILTPAGQEIYNDGVNAAIFAVMNSPTIDAVPVVHARRIKGMYMLDMYGYENTCSHCLHEYVVGFDYLYCPYCGARMDGEMKYDG